MSAWIEVGQLGEIPRKGARTIVTADGDIALFRTGDDEVYALADHCPHRGGKLSQGIVHGRFVTCPLHNWVIDLAEGGAVAPDEGCVARFKVKVEGGRIFLTVTPSEV